ncbi:MAG TPA: AGE family epimerase/isomerase, partial [Acidimicrobiales bacterium]
PGLDDKVLTEWNALMIATLAEAGAAADEPAWVEAAVRCADFLLTALRDAESTWMRSWQAGDGDRPAAARHHAYAVDHAALVDAFTRLAEATGEARWIAEARTVADTLLERFWDPDKGGLFTTGDGSDAPVVRQKDFLDNATPAANSLAATALLRLAALTGEDRYRVHGEQILALFAPLAGNAPAAFAHLLAALDLYHGGLTEVVVTGDRLDLVAEVQHRYLPSVVLAWGERYDSPLWEGRDDGQAYVCRNYACLLPASTVDELTAQLDS